MKKKKQKPTPVVIDFETVGIAPRPKYPPIPVGVSIKYPGKKSKYFAWGHITGNNCTYPEAKDELMKAWSYPGGLLFQNNRFDIEVAMEHMDMPEPDWSNVHETMYLLYLDDPHQRNLGLKESAERLLKIAPDEQDEVRDWLLSKQPVPGVKISASKKSDHYFGRYISLVPGDIVGKYAMGDTDRTEAIFNFLYPSIVERGMLEPYNREIKLSPILFQMEKRGVPVDLPRLSKDVDDYVKLLGEINAWVIKRLKANPDINLDSGDQLIAAMLKSGCADESLMARTKTGKYATNKESLLVSVIDKVLLAMLNYRTQLNTCLNTFMKPWLEVAKASGGFIYTTWNQIKSSEGASNVGTRTGRLSSTPNFQNIPQEFKALFRHDEKDPKKAALLPVCPFKNMPPLPMVRGYIIPFKNHVLIDRDYSQQEPRILAHFEGGSLLEQYVDDPWMDVHDSAQAELAKMGKVYDRKPVKNTNLGLIYGMGVAKMAERNDMTVNESKSLKDSILQLYPGLKDMFKEMKDRSKANIPIRTWGGREYYCEPPAIIDGRLRTFDYKMVNVLVQGSAADCTKEALIRFWDRMVELNKQNSWFILLNVHDQITVSVPKADCKKAMEELRKCMESVEFDVLMKSEGKISETNWADLVDYDKKGVLVLKAA